ncbi:MAG: hypothetical protein P4L88_14825 [Rhodoferax sp.]|nr:hypothetical protein [Rhodoferax sp.]
MRQLLDQRDKALCAWPEDNVLSDEKLELLSEIAIDVDARLALIFGVCHPMKPGNPSGLPKMPIIQY